ncbi:MAG: alpha/beta fold hydrolase [Trueperaceae bacterium]|nr:alpha/beta fold hydrolase [Trueperaceae bacterium]
MTRRLVPLVLALLASLALGQADPTGAWRGALGPGVIDLEIRVAITADGDAWAGTIDIPAQGLFGYPLAEFALDGSDIAFVMPGIPGDPAFAGVVDGDRIEGTFTQSGQALPFLLERDTDPGAGGSLRPQEPQPPFPYLEEEVAYASGDVTLAGTLTLPTGDARVPALLQITGSGAQDRNEEILGHKPFLVIADHLTRAGYAVLRVDDRGVGGSTGDDALATYDDMLGDVLAGVAWLRAHPRIDAERVGLLGHSQGGFLAPAAAIEPDAGIAFVILMAGPAVDGYSVLVAQNELILELAMRTADPSVSDEAIAAVVASQIGFLDALYPLLVAGDADGIHALVRERVESEMAAIPVEQRPDEAALEQLIAVNAEGTAAPAFRSFVTFDPQPLLRQLTVPTLALFGGLDLQVPAEQSEGPMREALAAAGNPDATVITFPGLNHLMQPATTGNVDEYGAIDITIDPVVLDTLADWLQERFPAR